MGYLKTILTYNVPSEAEVDKAFLESRGIAVCLLNANTARNELGAPFYIQLQVGDGDADAARSLIREVNPRRFGSSARVDEIDRQLRRALGRFALLGVPAGILVGLATYVLTPSPASPPTVFRNRHMITFDVRVELAVAAGLAACAAAALVSGRRRPKEPARPAGRD